MGLLICLATFSVVIGERRTSQMKKLRDQSERRCVPALLGRFANLADLPIVAVLGLIFGVV